ncbi:MAG: DUF4159 domain-containing protein [Gemmatimonadota bacterium]
MRAPRGRTLTLALGLTGAIGLAGAGVALMPADNARAPAAGSTYVTAPAGAEDNAHVTAPRGAEVGPPRAAAAPDAPLPTGAVAVREALARTGMGTGDVAYMTPPQRVICGKNRNEEYTGRFTFVRIFWEERMGRSRFQREPNWHHDCPYSESNLTSVLGAMTTLTPHIGGSVYEFGDEDLYRYPLAYVSEVGFWEPSEREIEHLRAYMLKGGLVIFDDFDGNAEIANLARILNRAVPEARLRELSVADRVFNSFFEVDPDSLRLGPSGGGGSGRNMPVYLGLFEDDDPDKRLMVLAFANNDVGEYMDYNPRGFSVVNMNNDAYKLGVNMIIYALTH